MGFKCPKCKKDFGHNHEEFTQHLLSSPQCALTSSMIFSKLQEVFDQIDDE